MDLSAIFTHFDIPGNVLEVAPYGSGHIHDTYCGKFDDNGQVRRYILQRINHRIFPHPHHIMHNISAVTAHLRRKLAPDDGETLTVIPTTDGRHLYSDGQGHWRVYQFIENSTSYDTIETPCQAYEIAKAFATFQYLLLDFPTATLETILPDFHHPGKRWQTLRDTIDRDPVGRKKSTSAEIEFAVSQAPLIRTWHELAREMPTRVVHNDTKVNNVLLDKDSGRALCVVDIDLVMPGLILYDVGDMIRSAVVTSSEDEKRLGKVEISLDNFDALLKGYLQVANDFLSALEKEHIALSARIITYELGMRFLTDYLNGDEYFKIRYPDHNLVRTRVQFQLVREMERRGREMQRVVQQC